MKPLTVIFIGRSGSGKGTQGKLLEERLKKEGDLPVLYHESGAHFRSFIEENGYTNRLARAVNDRGGLQPSFLPIYLWTSFFIKTLTPDEHLLLDGIPRKLNEARVLAEALSFYGRGDAFVAFLDVPREVAAERMRGRGRGDDAHEKNIEERMTWYESDVVPAIEFFRAHPTLRFLDIDGDRPIDAIAEDLWGRLAGR